MDLNLFSTIVILIILVLCVGFFTSSETAYLSLNKLNVRNMLLQQKKHARTIAKLKENIDRLLTTVLIGTNFLNSLLSSIATALAISLLNGSRAADFTPFITAFFITTFGQIVPKTAAGLYPEAFAGFSSLPLMFLEKIFFPVIWIFERLSHIAVAVVEKIVKPAGPIITQEELTTLIAVGENEGTIEKAEGKMLNKLIKFNDLQVTDIMKHRRFVCMVDEQADYQTVKKEFLDSGFSTLAVYKDTPMNITGVINYKTILYGSSFAKEEGFAKSIMSEVLYVPGTLSVLEMLEKFRNTSHKYAVVLNEQGETSGIITMEDVLRLVLGRMTDENSYNDLPAEDKIKLISHNTFLVPGEIKLEDLNEVLNLSLTSEDFTTLGGWLLEQFGHLPNAGEVLTRNNTLFIAEDIVQHRITSVRIRL